MLALFKSKPLLDAQEQQWLIDTFVWAVEHFDSEFFINETQLVLPNHQCFPDPVSSIEEITCSLKHPDFHIIPAGPIPPNPGEMLMDSRLTELMNELRLKYDVIIIDTAPVGYVSDLFQINEMLDATLYVVRHRITRKNWLKNAIMEVQTHKLKSLGIVINGMKRKKNKYKSYGYGYGYGQEEGKRGGRRKKLT